MKTLFQTREARESVLEMHKHTKYKMYGHLRKALSRNKQTSVHLRLIFPSTNQEDMQQR